MKSEEPQEELEQVSGILSLLAPILARGLSPDQRNSALRGAPVKLERSEYNQLSVYQSLLDAYSAEGNIDFVGPLIDRIQGYNHFFRPIGPELERLNYLFGQYLAAKKKKNRRPYVFAIMPFQPEFFAVYEKAVRPTLEGLGCQVEHAQEVTTVESLIDAILSKIKQADFLVADTTGKNANVFYELGYAHACGKKAILIVQDAKDLPFDVRGLRHILYATNAVNALSLELKTVASTLLSDLETASKA